MLRSHADLGPPPPLPAGATRIVPLGGLGEVGRNMAVLEHDGKLLVIDCGVLFPEEHQPGVDLVLPDFSAIADRLDDVVAVVLTHGHEDHVGALPYLLRLRADIPLVGSQLTLAFVEAKLREHRMTPYAMRVAEGVTEQLGPFACEFLAVSHSIPDALAVAVTTAAGTILHTGDFKLDQLPLDGRITDLRAFARVADRGVDVLMIDSTSADIPGFTLPERDIGPVLAAIMARAPRRVVVASFASHVHRVQQVLDAAAAHGRTVAYVGRSMVRNMGVARDLGYLRVPEGVLVDLATADRLPDDRVVIMSTGSQGEPMAALSRMAKGEHKVAVGEGDTVVLASSLIPGNENAVHRVINGLTRLGADVVHTGVARVHTGGHATAGELLFVYNLVRPRNVLPVHGEPRHLVANGRIAVASGVPADRVVVVEDGAVIDLQGGVARVVGCVPCADVYVDGSTVGRTTAADLADRRILGEEGFVSCFVVVDRTSGAITAGPHLHVRGLPADHAELAEALAPRIRAALADAVGADISEQELLQHAVRRAVGRWLKETYRRRPMIVPVVLSV